MRFLIWSVEFEKGGGMEFGMAFFLAGSFDLYWDSHHGIGALPFFFWTRLSLSLVWIITYHQGRAIHWIGQGRDTRDTPTHFRGCTPRVFRHQRYHFSFKPTLRDREACADMIDRYLTSLVSCSGEPPRWWAEWTCSFRCNILVHVLFGVFE